jgi:hypothetical protein
MTDRLYGERAVSASLVNCFNELRSHAHKLPPQSALGSSTQIRWYRTYRATAKSTSRIARSSRSEVCSHAARRIYEPAGFKLVAAKEHYEFRRTLVGKHKSSIWGNNRGRELLAGIQRSGAGPR